MTRGWAILLLGPTGSGKTPLGEHFERVGIPTRRSVHFDFGACLRAVAEGDACGLSDADVAAVRTAIAERALLRDDQFPIAAQLLHHFIAERDVAPHDLVILNGLPRHAGQATAVAEILDVRHVVVLDCDAETVAARIAGDTGGDRAGRSDDAPEDVAAKLATYTERTEPLILHYAKAGTPIHRVRVGASMSAADVWDELLPRLQQPDLCGRCGR